MPHVSPAEARCGSDCLPAVVHQPEVMQASNWKTGVSPAKRKQRRKTTAVIQAALRHPESVKMRLEARGVWARTPARKPGWNPALLVLVLFSGQILRLRLRMTSPVSERLRPYPALFTLTTVIFSKPSSKSGGFSLSAILRMMSSLTERSRWRLRSRHTSSGTSKKTACTS